MYFTILTVIRLRDYRRYGINEKFTEYRIFRGKLAGFFEIGIIGTVTA